MGIFLNVSLFPPAIPYEYDIFLLSWSNMMNIYLFSTVDTGSHVRQYQGISYYSAEYASKHFQLFMG